MNKVSDTERPPSAARVSLLRELKRRNVFRAGAAYVVTAWLVIQVVETIFPAFGFGDAAIRLAVIVLSIGFVPTLIVAWAFELTPEGLKREKDVDYSSPVLHRFGKKLDRVVMLVLVLALSFFTFDKFVLAPRQQAEQIEQARELAREQVLAEAESETESRKSIAVLPFINRSSNEEDRFFTDGIHDDLLTTISRIAALKVISRTSVMGYRDTTKKIPQIASELGVATVLEGSIQRSGRQVRINVQLIDAETDEHLWAEIFDRELTAANLFAIQSEITRAIASALQAALSPGEQQRINSTPTDNLVAYDAYLRGRQLMGSRITEQLKKAAEEFSRAVELDPDFALAWIGVADSAQLVAMYSAATPLEEALTVQENAINRALAIDGELGEAYASLGVFHDLKKEPDKAEEAFRRAIQLSPNYATAYHWFSNFLAVYPLRNEERMQLAQKASELDPRSSIIATVLGVAYEQRGLMSLAEQQYLKVIELRPDFAHGYRTLSQLYVYKMGRYYDAIVYALKARDLDPGMIGYITPLMDAYLELGDFAAVRKIRDRAIDLGHDDVQIIYADMIISLYENNNEKLHELIEKLLLSVENKLYTNYLAMLELGMGNTDRSRELYLSLEPGWLEPEQWPELLRRYRLGSCIISWVLLETGDEELGRRLLQESTAYHDQALPALFEHTERFRPEICYLAGGDKEKALQVLEKQFENNYLNFWPVWHRLPMFDLVRNDPRYQALLEGRQRIIDEQRKAVDMNVTLHESTFTRPKGE